MEKIIALSLLVVFSFSASAQNSYPTTGNVGINLGASTSDNKLQIGSNPQGWHGNDLVVSGDALRGSLAIASDANHSYIYGDRDIALRPGFGKWSVYAKGTTGYVGIGFTNPTATLHVLQSSNNDWASIIENNGGNGKGLRIRGAAGNLTPLLQIEDNYFTNRFLVRSDGNVGIGTTSPRESLHVKGKIYLEGTESYASGWLKSHFHWQGHSLIMGSEVGDYAHNTIELKAGGAINGPLDTYFQMFSSPAPNDYTLKIQLGSNGYTFFNGGNVGIGTTSPDEKLTVKGVIHTEEVRVDMTVPGPDYVFAPDYNLLPLSEVESYIKANKHLPEVPSAKQMEEEGLNLKEMNLLLLKKVEELTLHLIDLKKEIDHLKSK